MTCQGRFISYNTYITLMRDNDTGRGFECPEAGASLYLMLNYAVSLKLLQKIKSIWKVNEKRRVKKKNKKKKQFNSTPGLLKIQCFLFVLNHWRKNEIIIYWEKCWKEQF